MQIPPVDSHFFSGGVAPRALLSSSIWLCPWPLGHGPNQWRAVPASVIASLVKFFAVLALPNEFNKAKNITQFFFFGQGQLTPGCGARLRRRKKTRGTKHVSHEDLGLGTPIVFYHGIVH